MASEYDARGNIYAIATPDEIRERGIPLPRDVVDAAFARHEWAPLAVEALCAWTPGARPAGAKSHRTDGLLVGPFQRSAPFDLLIVNTDGTLAERSGNGLTIFAQAQVDNHAVATNDQFALRVHHDRFANPSPVVTLVEADELEGVRGFWLELGTPSFGAAAVGASGTCLSASGFRGHSLHRVEQLAALNQKWEASQFVRIGNPHCVTLLEDARDLPGFVQLQQSDLFKPLAKIAFSGPPGQGAGEPCADGVNLQWAVLDGEQRIVARIFERGEGPTASSGTSASAVACAAWMTGLVTTGIVSVVMPGGIAPIRVVTREGELQVSLFGSASQLRGQNSLMSDCLRKDRS